MAVFNPDVKDTQPQDYLKLSKPISDIQPDKSTGMLLASAGQDLTASVNIADEVIKKKIQGELYSQIDPIRDQFTNSVSALKPDTTTPAAPVDGGATPSGVPATPQWAANTWGFTPKAASPTAGPMSLVGDNSPDSIPSGISSGLDRVQTLQAAMDGKHISETPYIAQLNAVSKQMRTDYPGYRPYIDQQISSITGFDPANKLVSSVIQDAQNAAKNSVQERDKTLNFIKENAKLDNADVMYSLFQQNKVSSAQVMTWANQQLGAKYHLELNNLKRADIKGNNDLLKDQTIKHFGAFMDEGVLGQINTFDMGSGMTPVRLQQLADDRAAGKRDDLTDTDMAHYGILLSQQKIALSNKYFAEAQRKDPNTGRSIMDDMGGDATAVRQLINNRLSFFDELSKAYSEKDPSAANIHSTVAKTVLEDTKHNFLAGRDASINKWVASSSVINTLAPQLAPDMYKAMNLNNVPEAVKGTVMYNSSEIVAQPTWQEKGRPTSVNEIVGNSLSNGIKSPGVYQTYLDLSNQLVDPKTNPILKRNIAASFFAAPDALELLTKFQKDYVDPQGNRIPGKYAVFTQLTQPEITKNMSAFRNTNPQLWNAYVNWTQESFGNILFKNEINDLSQLTSNKGYHVAWDSDNHQFILRDQNKNRIDANSGSVSQRYVWQTLSNLNLGLRNLSHVAEANGSDVDAYLLGRLQQSGVNISQGIDNIPQKIMAAVLNSRKDKKNLTAQGEITGISVENK